MARLWFGPQHHSVLRDGARTEPVCHQCPRRPAPPACVTPAGLSLSCLHVYLPHRTASLLPHSPADAYVVGAQRRLEEKVGRRGSGLTPAEGTEVGPRWNPAGEKAHSHHRGRAPDQGLRPELTQLCHRPLWPVGKPLPPWPSASSSVTQGAGPDTDGPRCWALPTAPSLNLQTLPISHRTAGRAGARTGVQAS